MEVLQVVKVTKRLRPKRLKLNSGRDPNADRAGCLRTARRLVAGQVVNAGIFAARDPKRLGGRCAALKKEEQRDHGVGEIDAPIVVGIERVQAVRSMARGIAGKEEVLQGADRVANVELRVVVRVASGEARGASARLEGGLQRRR